jgi:hypothetical protein
MSKIMTNFRAEDMPGRPKKTVAKKPVAKKPVAPAPVAEPVVAETPKAEPKRTAGGGFKTEIAVE